MLISWITALVAVIEWVFLFWEVMDLHNVGCFEECAGIAMIEAAPIAFDASGYGTSKIVDAVGHSKLNSES